MKLRRFLILALCWPAWAMAGGNEQFYSDIPGVLLVRMGEPQNGYFRVNFDRIESEKIPDFLQYCDGSHSVHVHAGPFSSLMRCTAKATGDGDGSHFIELETKDKIFAHRAVLLSKTALPAQARSLPMTEEESGKLRKAMQGARAEAMREIRKTFGHQKYKDAQYKLNTPGGFVYIASLGPLESSPEDPEESWSIMYAVFREVGGRMEKTGELFGFIQGFRDLNADGTPEVFMSDGSTDDAFWSLTPEVKRVVGRTES